MMTKLDMLLNRIHARLAKLLLPRELYTFYGRGIQEAFEDILREAQVTGRRMSTPRAFIKDVLDLLRTSLRYRMRRSEYRGSGRSTSDGSATGGGFSAVTVIHDIRHALRLFLKRPGFTAMALATLAMGIGANAAVFSLVFTILMRTLPFEEPDRLVLIQQTASQMDSEAVGLWYPGLVALDERNRTFDGMAGFFLTDFTLTEPGPSERLTGSLVSWDFTQVLGVQPIQGRTFREDDEGGGNGRTVLIGEGMWERRFGADPNVIGATLTLGGRPAVVVGVMPAHFQFPGGSEIWEPFSGEVDFADGKVVGVGRLAPSTSMQAARQDLDGVLGTLSEHGSSWNEGGRIHMTPARDWLFAGVKEPVVVFYAVACLVLFLTCVNVASMQLAKNEARSHEMAVRSSLGASRIQIVRLILVENLLLSVVGGCVGVAAGYFMRDLILVLLPVAIPPYFTVELQPAVLLVTAAIVLSSGLLAGLIPAIQVSRVEAHGVLKATMSGRRKGFWSSRTRSLLVALEVSLAVVVLIGTNLMVKSSLRQLKADTGFDPEAVATAFVTLHGGKAIEYYGRVLQEVRSMPGIDQASIATELPGAEPAYRWPLRIEKGALSNSNRSVREYSVVICEPEYFETMGIPMLEGRDFSDGDGSEGLLDVGVVNQSFASVNWPNDDPLGKWIVSDIEYLAGDNRLQVVGVVGDTYIPGPGRSSRPTLFVPYASLPEWDVFLVARTSLDVRSSLGSLRQTLSAIDPAVPISRFRTMEQVVFAANWRAFFYSWGLGLFSLIAVVLVVTGIHSVTVYSVTRRSREYAIRIAIGASNRSILRAVLRRAFATIGLGVLSGILVSLAGMRLVESQLFTVSPVDPSVYILSVAMLLGAALLASYLPARRICNAAPMTALVQE